MCSQYHSLVDTFPTSWDLSLRHTIDTNGQKKPQGREDGRADARLMVVCYSFSGLDLGQAPFGLPRLPRARAHCLCSAFGFMYISWLPAPSACPHTRVYALPVYLRLSPTCPACLPSSTFLPLPHYPPTYLPHKRHGERMGGQQHNTGYNMPAPLRHAHTTFALPSPLPPPLLLVGDMVSRRPGT